MRGVAPGEAVVPLRVAADGYRAVEDCWIPYLPMRWSAREGRVDMAPERAFAEKAVDLLLSVSEPGDAWPIYWGALDAVVELAGALEASGRFAVLAGEDSRRGEAACAHLCRVFGRCGCVKGQRARVGVSEEGEKEMTEAVAQNAWARRHVERALRFADWPALLAMARCRERREAREIYMRYEDGEIRRLAARLAL